MGHGKCDSGLDDPPPPVRRRRRWLGARAVVLVIVLGVGVAVGGWWAVHGAAPPNWMGPVGQWKHALHQRLQATSTRANRAVEQAAQTNRQLGNDDALSAAVADALVASQSADLGSLQVQTSHAMVTLRGSVSSLDLRDRAVAIATRVSGVQAVFSLISVATATR